MKLKSSLRSFLALAGSALLTCTTADADTLFWDGGDTGANAQGGSGPWNLVATNWDTAATAGANAQWSSSNPDFAVFGTPAGTVTLGSGIITSGMQFNVHSYVIDASTNALTFAAGNNTVSTNFVSAAGNITSINGGLAGTEANLLFSPTNPRVTPVGNIISLGGASSGGWTGTTTIDKNMVLRIQDTNQALLNTSEINLRGGVILLVNNDTQNALNRVNNSAVINSYGGSIRINNAVAAVNYSESMGELDLHGGNFTYLNLNAQSTGTQIVSFSSITRDSGSFATMNVGSTLNATSNIVRNQAVTSATATNEIIGPWMIQGNATSQSEYTRYDASGNILGYARPGANNINAEASLPTAWASTANMNYTGSPTLTENRVMNTLRTNTNGAAYQLGDFSLATNGILAGGGNLTFSTPTGTGFITAAGNPGSGNAIYINSANGFIALNAPIKDNGNPVTAVLVSGTNGGRIDLNVANEHSGGTVISSPVFMRADGQLQSAGSVRVLNVNGLGANTNLLRVESGNLDLGANSVTVGKFEGYVSSTITGTNTSTVLTVGQGTTSDVTGDYAGTIAAISLTKVGDGTQILSGTSTYTGATLVSAGTLLVNGSLGASAVTVNAGAFGGTGTIGSTLDLNAGSFHVVDLFNALQVAGTVTLYAGFGIDDLAGLDWSTVSAGTYTLIDGTLGAGVFDGLSHNSLGSAYEVGFGKTAYFQQGSLQLVVIPEPSTALLGGLGLLALLRRRR